MLLIKNELITSPLVLGRLAGRVKSTRSRWKMYARLWKSHRTWFLSDAACEFVNLRDVKTHTLGADVAPVGTVGIHTTRLVCRVWFLRTLSIFSMENLEDPRQTPPSSPQSPLTKLLSGNHYITISLSRFQADPTRLLINFVYVNKGVFSPHLGSPETS